MADISRVFNRILGDQCRSMFFLCTSVESRQEFNLNVYYWHFNSDAVWYWKWCVNGLYRVLAFLSCSHIQVFTIRSMYGNNTVPVATPVLKNAFSQLQMISSMICDFVISVSLVHYFRALRVGMTRTDSVLQQLSILSIIIGMLLSIATAVSLALFDAKPGTFFSLAPHFILVKLYVNSLMATLNSRKQLRQKADRSIIYSIPHIKTDDIHQLRGFST